MPIQCFASRCLFPFFSMLLFSVWLVSSSAKAQIEQVAYDRDIRPILSDRCFACHGPDADSREAGLRLDKPDGEEGSHQSAIAPGSLDDSELWNRVTSTDESEIMPPPDAHKKALTDSEKQMIKQWIETGAKYETFWAFKRLTKPKIPQTKNVNWSRQSIDQFVLDRLESNDLKPASTADERTLIRRLTFDLTGVPPTPTEIHEYLADQTQLGTEQAWLNLVDRLIARPQFGEHMARYWLDLVRFADTNGMHKDFYRNNVEYRDWVIRAFNRNLGYDDFLKFQLAGDLFEQPTEDQLIASGFHRLHLIIDRGTALPKESFTKNVVDRVTAVGTGFMGMTVHCAQCHDHKYDPISQKDFYSLFAFFNSIDAEPETVARPQRGLQQPFVSFATSEQKTKLADLDKQLNALDKQIGLAKKEIVKAKATAKGQSESDDKTNAEDSAGNSLQETQKLSKQLKEIEAERKRKKQERDRFDRTIRYAMVMKEREEVRPTFVLNRGQYDSPGEEVARDTPAFLPP